MQADVEKRRLVCFYRHFFQCFSRFWVLELSPDRHHSWPSPDDPPTALPDPGPKLSPVSESLGKRGYTKVAIGCGSGNEKICYAKSKQLTTTRKPRLTTLTWISSAGKSKFTPETIQGEVDPKIFRSSSLPCIPGGLSPKLYRYPRKCRMDH